MLFDNNSTHSPVGASGAERWMNCPGSVRLPGGAWMEPDEAPEYQTRGTSAHELAAECIAKSCDTWELMGQKVSGVEIDSEIASGVQVYLDEIKRVRALANRADAPAIELVEAHLIAKDHPLCYGTLDFAAISGSFAWLRDYKHGAGVVVDVSDDGPPEEAGELEAAEGADDVTGNPQFLYYAYLLIDAYPQIKGIEIGVVQPNAFHPDGPVRTWVVTSAEVLFWARNKMLPALAKAVSEASELELLAGEWCRFCPKKLGCPVLHNLFRAAVTTDVTDLPALDTESLGREYALLPMVKKYGDVLKAEMYRRLNSGEKCEEAKLVYKKTNRVWKGEADEIFTAQFGAKAYTTATLLSPAQMEKVGPDAKELVREYAYTPVAGTTVALRSDKRSEVIVKTSTEVFSDIVKELT